MEDLIISLNELLKSVIEIQEVESDLLIEIKIKEKLPIPGDLGTPQEVREMIQKFGGISPKISMEIEVNQEAQVVSLKMTNMEDFKAISDALKGIWEKASDLLLKAFNAEPGKIDEFRALGDFDENY
jgi:hypothetical protein